MREHQWTKDGTVLSCPCGVSRFGQEWRSGPGLEWKNGKRNPIPDCHADLVTAPTPLEQSRNEGFNEAVEAIASACDAEAAKFYPHAGKRHGLEDAAALARAMRKP